MHRMDNNTTAVVDYLATGSAAVSVHMNEC